MYIKLCCGIATASITEMIAVISENVVISIDL